MKKNKSISIKYTKYMVQLSEKMQELKFLKKSFTKWSSYKQMHGR
jgi:hypothetical protein